MKTCPVLHKKKVSKVCEGFSPIYGTSEETSMEKKTSEKFSTNYKTVEKSTKFETIPVNVVAENSKIPNI